MPDEYVSMYEWGPESVQTAQLNAAYERGVAAGRRQAAADALRDMADRIDRGPAIPLPPSVYSALIRERADDIAEGAPAEPVEEADR